MREGCRGGNAGGESSGGGMNVVATGRGLTVAALASVRPSPGCGPTTPS